VSHFKTTSNKQIIRTILKCHSHWSCHPGICPVKTPQFGKYDDDYHKRDIRFNVPHS
jgi:hypothetical protein